MKKMMPFITLLVWSLLFCNAGGAASLPDDVVARVNGRAISQGQYDAYADYLSRNGVTFSGPEQEEEAVMTGLIDLEILNQIGKNEGVDKREEVVANIAGVEDQIAIQEYLKIHGDQALENWDNPIRMRWVQRFQGELREEGFYLRPEIIALKDVLRRRWIATAVIADYQKNNPVTEELIKDEYNQFRERAGIKEYKARHILVRSEEEAYDSIKALDGGADFATLARSRSLDNAEAGGDLGWFRPYQMVLEFAAGLRNLAKGEYNNRPVKTEFGWHVILLEDERKPTVPSYEEVRDGIAKHLASKGVNSYVSNLRASAKIEK